MIFSAIEEIDMALFQRIYNDVFIKFGHINMTMTICGMESSRHRPCHWCSFFSSSVVSQSQACMCREGDCLG